MVYPTIIFLRPPRRRPIYVGPYWQPDVQARLPRWWCGVCGREVFEENCRLCDRCR